MRELEIGRVEPTSWVVTYISHIEYEGAQSVGPTVAKAFTVWTDQTSDGWLPPPDRVVLDMAFPMPDNAGRLHVTSAPVVRLTDKKEMLRLDITARGKAKAKGTDKCLGRNRLGP